MTCYQIDEHLESTDLVTRAIRILAPREERIIRLRFGLGKLGFSDGEATLQEIGDDLGLSAERIRILEQKALRKMKTALSRKLWRCVCLRSGQKIPWEASRVKPRQHRAIAKRIGSPAARPFRLLTPSYSQRLRDLEVLRNAYAAPPELVEATKRLEALASKTANVGSGPRSPCGHLFIEVINDWVEGRSNKMGLSTLHRGSNYEAIRVWLATAMDLVREVPHGVLYWRVRPEITSEGRVYSRFAVVPDTTTAPISPL